MAWLSISLHTDDRHAEALADAFLAHGALSASIEDADAGTADETPQFGEPGSPTHPGWQHSRVVALLPADARAVDLVVIPCRPTAFDLAAAGSAVEVVKAAGARAVFVLSACPFRSPEIAETRTVLESYGLPVAPTEVTDRRAFARAVATGRAVTEFDAHGKAADEIRAFWNWLKEQIK